MPRISSRFTSIAGCAVLFWFAIGGSFPAVAGPQIQPTPAVSPAKPKKLKPAKELIRTQDPAVLTPRVYDSVTPDNAFILVSLSRQRAYLMTGPNGEIAIDSPISSGKSAGMTPKGSYTVLEKDPDHRSSVYGNFVDRKGRVVRSGVSTRIDSAPSGTRFVGAPMWFFMRLTWQGVGMHVGILPGYPASHGCIRLPAEIAPRFYEKVKIGTPAQIID